MITNFKFLESDDILSQGFEQKKQIWDCIYVDDKQRYAGHQKPYRHANPKNDAKQGYIEYLEVHFISKDARPQKETYLYRKENNGSYAP